MSSHSADPSAQIAELQKQVADLQARLARVEATPSAIPGLPLATSGTAQAGSGQVERVSMVVFSGTLDHAIAAFTIATAAAASGMEVEMFFTFWGFAALRDPKKSGQGKTLIGKMFSWMLPRGTRKLPLSQWNMGGAGAKMIRSIMQGRKVASVEELMAAAADLGVVINACEMSMGLMGIGQDELIDYPTLKVCGAATFIERASAGKVTLFI
ncbi:MAG: DsrE/DsrF/DrsH-like family protein [Myxococcales bacterium]|nr:DsrE/DsrF/DrsH-like family protein [Myxococcales bacterium]